MKSSARIGFFLDEFFRRMVCLWAVSALDVQLEILVEAGLNRAEVYVTNAVKHFKWEPRGKRHS